MKLGVSYNMYDGYEMLESSIKTIRPSVDYINVIMQTVSNHGEIMSPDDVLKVTELLNKLVREKLIDDVIPIKPNLKSPAWCNELSKRQFGYDTCAKAGCTHFLSMDVDEFYNPIKLEHAKQLMEQSDCDTSICKLIDYYGDMNHHYPKYSGTNVPFIYKITEGRRFNHNAFKQPVLNCDPTRQMDTTKIFMFDPDDIVMHHGTMVRASSESVRMKLTNSSARVNFTPDVIQEMVEYYENWPNGGKEFGAHIQHDPQMNTSLGHLPLTEVKNGWLIK